jgi:hypothetical protein
MERPQALIGEEWCSAEPDEPAVYGNQGFAESTRELDCRLLPSESACIWFFNDLQHRGDCQNTRKSCKKAGVVGWAVGWETAWSP